MNKMNKNSRKTFTNHEKSSKIKIKTNNKQQTTNEDEEMTIEINSREAREAVKMAEVFSDINESWQELFLNWDSVDFLDFSIENTELYFED